MEGSRSKPDCTHLIGFQINGENICMPIPDGQARLDISPYLKEEINDILIYKRLDALNYLAFYGFETEGVLIPLPPRPERRIEVYGDSVSVGILSEATDCTGQADPAVDAGHFSDSFHSYAAITARNLHAELHNISQNGIALVSGRGWFRDPICTGMDACWDKAAYHPDLAPVTTWDFSQYTPHIVIVALGHNDARPKDIMKLNPDGEEAHDWIRAYVDFVRQIRNKYPVALILLLTTILNHHPSWDIAIEKACLQLDDPDIRHFIFQRNGSATPGHPRISEHVEMADELTSYIQALDNKIWKS